MADRPPDPASESTLAPEAVTATISRSETVAAGAAGGSGALRPGVVVAETYEITRLLGQGGMGAVWEAKHLRLPDKRVVVKVLLFGVTDAVALARFRREAEIASRLGHPNIVQVLDFNTLPDGAPYIVLELLRGETLAARLGRGRPPFAETMAIVGQVGSALAAAHREGIVHRDLKPDNLFLCPTEIGGEVRDVVKVLDFGISKIRGAKTVLTQDSALIGTPQYMAPEQATGRNDDIDARTDIFAFGAIVFEMLAGHPPFSGDTLAAVIHAVVYAPTPPLREFAPDVPAPIAAAIERALAKSPDERFPDVGSFVKAVTARSIETAPTMAVVVPREPVAPPAPSPAGIATERVVPRRSFPIVPVIVGVALLGGVGAWFVANRNGPEAPAAAPPPIAIAAAPLPPPPAIKPADQPPPIALREPAVEPAKEHDPGSSRAPGGVPRAAKQETLSPAAASDLAEAEASLDAGRIPDAIRLAQHSLYAQTSSRAYAIIARARCAQGDLGNARAALARVGARDRAAVVRACGKLGVDLN